MEVIKEVVIKGDAGRLEGKYHQSENKNAPIALVLHPHPLHGGTMNNKVVYHVFHSFVQQDFSVLRINFRGVNKSQGEFDHGVGELLDAAVALDWLQTTNVEASSCWIAGFSFGAWIALRLLMRRPEIDGFVAVSPPATDYDFNFLSPCPASGIFIQGSEDKIVLEKDVYALYDKISKQRHSDVEYALIEGAGHFFENQVDELRMIIDGYLEEKVVHKFTPRKTKRDRRRKQNTKAEE